MKKIFITLLLMMPVLLIAQNYNNICSQGSTFFKKRNTTMLKAYRAQSFSIPVAGDTIFNSFLTIRDTASTCLDTTKGSIFGRKIRSTTDAVFLFFNKKNDTIFIRTKAALNDTWKFLSLSSTIALEAKVVSIGTDSVINTIDEVKKIELTAKRNDGSVVPSPWNGKYFKISRKYGLSEFFDMVNMPSDTTKYFLVGKQKPVIGVQDYGWREVYNFNIGDALHYSGYLNSLTGGPTSSWKEIQTLISRTNYGSGPDSVVYRFDRCKSTVTQPGSNHVYIHDTISVKYKFTQLNNDSTIWRSPDQFVRQNIYASQFDRYMKSYNNRVTKKVGEDIYRFINGCFSIPQGATTLTRGYTEGLGMTEFYRYDSEHSEYNKLVYFKKGSESWGSPVGYECSPYLSVDEEVVNITRKVTIVPNPMKQQADVLIEGMSNIEGMQFSLYNIVGKKVYGSTITSNPMTLQRNDLPAGIYIWTVSGKDFSAKGKLIAD